MTLSEAIAHCQEVAEENEKQAKKCKGKCCIYTDIAKCENGAQGLCNQCKFSYDSTSDKLCECASEHRQLAEWLRELKGLRIAVYKLSRIPYGEHLTYNADDVWELFGTYFADFEEEVMDYEEVNADEK